MTFDATHILRFVNQARTAIGLRALDELSFLGAEPVSERGCVLARALLGEVGGSEHPAWDGAFVLRLADPALAEAIAAATGQPCHAAEVMLPDELANLAVGFDHGSIGARDGRYLHVGQLCFDDLKLRLVRGTTCASSPGRRIRRLAA